MHRWGSRPALKSYTPALKVCVLFSYAWTKSRLSLHRAGVNLALTNTHLLQVAQIRPSVVDWAQSAS